MLYIINSLYFHSKLITNKVNICISCAIQISTSFIDNIYFMDKQMNIWSKRPTWESALLVGKKHPKFVQNTYIGSRV